MTGDHLYYDYRTLFNAMHDVTLGNGALYRCIDEGMILDLPTADVRENVRGEWISHDLENVEKSIDKDCCSVCGERFREIAMTGCEWNFCPNCGADMRGDKT